MMEAATGPSDTSGNLLPDYMAYALNLHFNLFALNSTENGEGGLQAITQIQRPLYMQ